jgi:hypothetical protein
VTQIALATIRLRFTQDPLAVSSSGANDATNPFNYVLSGPGLNAISSAAPVFSDPQAIDLFLAGPLVAGTWTITVATNVQMTDATTISNPRSGSFTVTLLSAQEPVAKGAVTDGPAEILRKHLNPALKGDAWDALIAAIATGDQKNLDAAKTAFDQLFKISASGIYLERKAADDGLQKPKNIGMPDELFRQYAIKNTTGKLVEGSLLDILEVFYGADSVRAHVDSGLSEPFFMEEGDDLVVVLDENKTISTVFMEDDFAIAGIANAAEVAAALTRSFRFNDSRAFAVAVTDPQDGTTKVRIYSGALGLSSSARVSGGKAQNSLQFADLLPTWDGLALLPTWTITKNLLTNRIRFAKTVGGVLNPDLNQVRIGDYVNIYGIEFLPANRGSFAIVDVYIAYPAGVLTEYFEIENVNGTAQSVTQVEIESMIFFRPTRKTIHTSRERAVVVSSLPDEVDIVLPATSQAVGRSKTKASYGQLNAGSAITSLERIEGIVSVTTATNHGLAIGDQVMIDGVFGATTIPGTVAGSYPGPLVASTSDLSKGSIWSATAGTVHANGAAGGVAVRLLDGRIFHGFGYALVSGSINDSITFFNGLMITGQTRLANGSIQVAFIETDQGGGSNAVPHALNYPGASLGINPSWYYGQVFVSGGESLFGGRDVVTTTGVFTPTISGSSTPGTYANGTTVLVTKRAAHAQVTLNVPGTTQHGGFFAMGGLNVGGDAINPTALSSCERYSAVEGLGNNFVAMASMAEARVQHQAVVLQDGRVLVIGGRSLGTGSKFYWSVRSEIGAISGTCEIYNPWSVTINGQAPNTWAYTGRLANARFGHRALLLNDGRVLVVGGIGFNPTQPTTDPIDVLDAEIWNPTTGAWQPAGKLNWGRDTVVAEYLSSRNQVVVAGGSDVVGGFKTELFDPVRMKWTVGSATLATRRAGAASAIAGDDLIAIVGGYNPATGNSASSLSLYVPNADKFLGGGLNGIFQVVAPVTATTFTYETNETQYTLNGSSDGIATPVKAVASAIPGPYIFSPDDGVAVTSNQSTTAQDLNKGQRYASVEVADATQFPDEEGWLVFSFGYDNQVAPVKYFGRLSATSLSLDYGFKFPATVKSGTNVTALAHKGPFVPDAPEDVGSFYITASPAGRVAAQQAIEAAVGAGITVNSAVVFPGDRGLAGEGLPASGSNKLSDKVAVWGSDDVDADLAAAREE